MAIVHTFSIKHKAKWLNIKSFCYVFHNIVENIFIQNLVAKFSQDSIA